MKGNLFTDTMQSAGLTHEHIANMLAEKGCGDANSILNGIKNKDEKALSFLPKMVKEIKERNPMLFNQFCARYGVKNNFLR